MSNRDDCTRVNSGIEKLKNAPKRRKVFDSLLKGMTNQQIVEELGGKSKGTVSKTVSTIYEIFGLSKEDSKNLRKELIALIIKHRPDLVPHLHKLYPPSGFVPLNSPLYVTRCEDKDFEDALLSKYHNFFQIKGTKGIGKSSLLFRGKQLLEETMEHEVLFIDLASQIFTETELTDLDSFLCQFSYVIEKEFGKKLNHSALKVQRFDRD
ncbi:MAG: AAA-like domain-containing protein [Microcystaceae cyanobacterium]